MKKVFSKIAHKARKNSGSSLYTTQNKEKPVESMQNITSFHGAKGFEYPSSIFPLK
tara:strand:- start:55773 stop:55940 length:168 start_codon:yes stop_codon:yes gene_type:complete